MKRIISLLTLLALCLTFFGCEENEQDVQNISASESVEDKKDQDVQNISTAESVEDKKDQDDLITVENGDIYGKIIEKIEPNILQIEPGNVRFKNEYGEKVDIITDQFGEWEIDAEIEVTFTKYKAANGIYPTRIYAENVLPLMLCYKPIIYFYPEIETVCSAELLLNCELTCTYPDYKENGWSDFIAQPDGTLTFPDGKSYYALYWEGVTFADWDLSRGFCVKGEDTASFLEQALAQLGLTEREANEFIIYWLPLMQNNAYNVISFQTEAYTESAVLKVTPTPDTLLRVFMTYYPSETEIEIEPQTLEFTERKGFTVVEWGGSRVEKR